jgi:DNA repair photolyase
MLDPATAPHIGTARAKRRKSVMAAIKGLAAAGIPTHVNVAPIIPAINDS